jgi:lipopolysaccharide/colanic/teichoic acid biosynthesis glycosyltransferase
MHQKSYARKRTPYEPLKRLLDISVSLIGLVVLLPLLILIFFIVRADLGAPALFLQWRPGKNGRPFLMVKFRTMRAPTGESEIGDADSERITPVGAFLRNMSIDEIPELWNVLRGDMSIVGPRPLLMEYIELYTPEQARRHDVRPGITGLAQVNGRNLLSWEEKFELDVQYVEHKSFLLDLQILYKTLLQLARRNGISAPNEATAPRFRGSPSASRGMG